MILHVIDMGPAGGGAPPLVLLHGLLGTARNFGTLQRQVATSRRVVALDLRNHGASAHGDAMDYPTMAADVRETLAQHAALPAMIMGHSMGGKVAMRLALEHPDTVARLLVSDIAPVAYPATDGALVQAMAAITLSPGLTRASADAQLRTSVPDPAIRAFLLQNLRPGESPSWRVGLRQIAAALPAITGWPTPPTGATYGGPTLFVAGARSDYIEAAARPVIRGLFPEARFVKVKDAGHWVHADNPAAFLAVLEGFCAAT